MVDESAAWQLLEQLRWGGAPQSCPHCAADGSCYFLAPAGGRRTTRTGRITHRRVWKCGRCRRQFSVLTGTVLAGTRISLATWVDAIERFDRTGSVTGTADVSPAARRHMQSLLGAVQVVAGRAGSAAQEPGRCQD